MMYMSKPQLQKAITQIKSQMQKAVKALDFMEAARLRDNMYEMEAILKEKKE